MVTKSPSKQRKMLYQAPLHKRQKLVSAHLVKELRRQYSKRSIPLRKGDEVKVVRGKFKKRTGKISKVDLKKLKVYIEGIKRKKVSGEEVPIPFHPSNLIITNPVMEDAKRKKLVTRKKTIEKVVK